MTPEIIANWILEHDFEYDHEGLYASLRMHYDSTEANYILKKAERLANIYARLERDKA
jgi:hypothetical protein